MTAPVMSAARHIDGHGTWPQTRRALIGERWWALTWLALLSAAVYASAKATPWLYPTTEQQARAAESINASPAIVALYGPILDTHSLGELAMTKLTVLYSVFVAVMCIIVVRRRLRVPVADRGQSRASLTSAMAEASILSVVVGVLAAITSVAAGLPPLGSVMFGASWAGIGVVATMLTATAYQLPVSFRARGWITAGAIGLLYAVRAIGDASSATWLSWLSPFGWSTRLEAWSTPRGSVLALYVLAAFELGLLALHLHSKRDVEADVVPEPSRRRDWIALAVWTVATSGLAVLYGVISPEIGVLLESTTARQLIERLGGAGSLRDALIGAEFSIVAAVVTAFGVSVVHHAADDEESTFTRVSALALTGSTWLLLVTGVMFTLGHVGTGGSMTGRYLMASLNHAPAVWTVIGLAIVVWSFRPSWSAAGWVLLTIFVVLGQVGAMIGAPRWVLQFSPYTRIALMPAEPFDLASTLALTAGACVLLAVAAYNSGRRSR